jgi:hypothetical protein
VQTNVSIFLFFEYSLSQVYTTTLTLDKNVDTSVVYVYGKQLIKHGKRIDTERHHLYICYCTAALSVCYPRVSLTLRMGNYIFMKWIVTFLNRIELCDTFTGHK